MPRNPDRTDLCHFTYSDGRRCTLPQFPDDVGLCFHHGQKYRQRLEAREAGRRVSRFLETEILTACDLSCTLSALFGATAMGYLKPKTAATLGYLAQLMLQAQTRAKQEYTDTYVKPWQDVVSDGPAFNDADYESACEDEPATTGPEPVEPQPALQAPPQAESQPETKPQNKPAAETEAPTLTAETKTESQNEHEVDEDDDEDRPGTKALNSHEENQFPIH